MFQHLDPYAGDPILSLNEDFQKDPRPHKINLSIGIYFDDAGRIPVLDCVRDAEAQMLAESGPKPYLPIEGAGPARAPCRSCCSAPTTRRAQRPHRDAADRRLQRRAEGRRRLLKRWFPGSRCGSATRPGTTTGRCSKAPGWRCTPTPTTTRPPAACASTPCCADAAHAAQRSVVLLHACCHNPTGVDLTPRAVGGADPRAAGAPTAALPGPGLPGLW
jgi:aromatic-amino-acid transaminase